MNRFGREFLPVTSYQDKRYSGSWPEKEGCLVTSKSPVSCTCILGRGFALGANMGIILELIKN